MRIEFKYLVDSFLTGKPLLPFVVGKHILLIAVLINIIHNIFKRQLYLPVMRFANTPFQLIQISIFVVHTHHSLDW